MFFPKVYAFRIFISSALRMILVVYTELGVASDIYFIFSKYSYLDLFEFFLHGLCTFSNESTNFLSKLTV